MLNSGVCKRARQLNKDDDMCQLEANEYGFANANNSHLAVGKIGGFTVADQ